MTAAPAIQFTAHQRAAMDAVSRWLGDPTGIGTSREPGVFRLFGHAGSGKSSLARHLAESVGGPVRYAAFTGKAALVMQRKGCTGASTIHRLIYLPRQRCHQHLLQLEERLRAETDPDRRRELQGEVERERANVSRPAWNLNLQSSLREAALLVLDEVSMIGARAGQDLLSFGTPILALGDPAQLPPVKDRGYFTDPRQEPDFLLTEVHRQAEGSPVLHLATLVRQGLVLPRGQHGTSAVVAPRDLKLEDVLAAHDQIIVGRNETRRRVNTRARRILFGTDDPRPVAGDRLMCLRNDHELGLLNGSQWRCLEAQPIDEERLILTVEPADEDDTGAGRLVVEAHAAYFRGAEPRPYEIREAQSFDFAYAITCHKCVHPDTLIETEQGGLQRISDAAGSGKVTTSEGLLPYRNKVENPENALLRVRTKLGYEVAVTPEHLMMAWDGGRYDLCRADQLEPGTFLRLPLGIAAPGSDKIPADVPPGDVREVRYDVPVHMSAELAEFFGLFVADGTLFYSGFRLLKRHEDVAVRFGQLCRILFGATPRPVTGSGATGYEVSSRHLARWLLSIGGLAPNQKAVPGCILSGGPRTRRAFLRGLFEDGSASRKDRAVEWSTAYSKLAQTVQVMLLGLGLPATLRQWSLGPSSRWAVYLNGDAAVRFGREIGFVSAVKNSVLAAYPAEGGSRLLVPIARRETFANKSAQMNARTYGHVSATVARRILDPEDPRLRFVHDKIVSVAEEIGSSMCVEVPNHGRFLQSGFDGSNSQGSQWRSVCVVDEGDTFGHEADRWRYTAITRASEKVTVVR